MKKFRFLLISVFMSFSLNAQVANVLDNNISISDSTNKEIFLGFRLLEYEPSYLIWNTREDDEDHLKIHYSFKYLLNNNEIIDDENYTNSWYFSYTGEFDFYVGTRESGPVVNRMNNPAIHFQKEIKNIKHIKWIDFSLQHRSNGQVIDVDRENMNFGKSPIGKTKNDDREFETQVQYDKNNHIYFESLSRSSNYIQVETEYVTDNNISIGIRIKPFYINDDSAVNWDPNIDKDTRIMDYDRALISLSKKYNFGYKMLSYIRLGVQWRVGDKLLETDSTSLDFELPVKIGKFRIPIYARAHFGSMSTLSNYTKEQDSFGIGFILK